MSAKDVKGMQKEEQSAHGSTCSESEQGLAHFQPHFHDLYEYILSPQ